MQTIIIIPARFKSTRFPGKPLERLKGRPAIQWTHEAANRVKGIDSIYVATDDDTIKAAVESFGGKVLMTSSSCQNGSERVAEAAKLLNCADDDIVINFQGDAPLTPPWFVEALVDALKNDPEADMATPVLQCDQDSYNRFKEDRKHGRVGATTAVFDIRKHALYFSKEVIPYLPKPEALKTSPVYHHVGIYAFRTPALFAYPTWKPGPLENAEQLEQLRFLENGKSILCVEVDANGHQFWELNNPEDVERIETMMDENAKNKQD